jgi:hypothetical protein
MSGTPATQSSRSSDPPACVYPQSNRVAGDIRTVLAGVAANKSKCTSFYLDTVEGMSNNFPYTEGEDHHQGLARTHKLSDGSIYFFLSHSETDTGDQGSLSQYRYGGPTDQDHILSTNPLTVAPMKQLVMLDEQHPSDITFLPEVNGLDAGYLFVTEEYDQHRLVVYRWDPVNGLAVQGPIFQGFPSGGPNFVFIDKIDDNYYLGIASSNWGWGKLFCARDSDLFPNCEKGSMNVTAFEPAAGESMFPFPVIGGASQNKLIRDAKGLWYLLGFRSDPDDDPHGTDYVDVYEVAFSPFRISYRLGSVHISFRPGDTGFASTGTHYVEKSGRLLVSSSYRWAEDEGPGNSGYVSRVDECPSS